MEPSSEQPNEILLRVLTYSNGMCDAPCCEDPDCFNCQGLNTGAYGIFYDEDDE